MQEFKKLHKVRLFFLIGYTILLSILGSLCLILFVRIGVYEIAVYQDMKVHHLHTKDKVTIENTLFLYTKVENYSHYEYNIEGLESSNENYYWIRYKILGVMPFDIIYNTNHQCITTISRYE